MEISDKLAASARIAIENSLRVKPGEQVLIVTNPDGDVARISRALFDAALKAGGKPVIVTQPVKTALDFAEKSVLAAFEARPEVVISISAGKIGKDERAIAKPYEYNGQKYDHIFHLLQYGERSCRAFWSPTVTVDMFERTVPIDYALLKERCAAIKRVLDKAVSVRVTAPGGTGITLGLRGREAKLDDGDFSAPGSGGNLPAGETFISPENGTACGVIVFDGSQAVSNRVFDGTLLLKTPIRCEVKSGFVTKIEGGKEAASLLETVTLGEQDALALEKKGKLPKGQGAVYAGNARNIGELGIGLNPAARISGNMLEDEKAFKTCHFAIGQNYDEDAPSLIHEDGLVKNPTITAIFQDNTEQVIERDGELCV